MMHIPPTPTQVAAAIWIKSSASAPDNECVEVAAFPSWIAVRDSKVKDGPHFLVSAKAFAALVDNLAADTD